MRKEETIEDKEANILLEEMLYGDSKALCKYSQWAIDENMKKMSVITSRGMNDKQMLNRQMSYGWRRPVLLYAEGRERRGRGG